MSGTVNMTLTQYYEWLKTQTIESSYTREKFSPRTESLINQALKELNDYECSSSEEDDKN